MKKNLLIAVAAISLLAACEKNDSKETITNSQEQSIDMSDFFIPTEADLIKDAKASGRKEGASNCSAMEILSQQIKEDPSLYNKMYNIEYNTRKFLKEQESKNTVSRSNYNNSNIINIPVYVHVVYSDQKTNISTDQINSQIEALNRDYRKTNSDVNNAPREFANLAADMGINFNLVKIFRHYDQTKVWPRNAMKYKFPPITPETHLNIWVCQLENSSLGYGQFPGGKRETDGIVISTTNFGSRGNIRDHYNLGRTGTHEVGHYLGLRHIWGDGGCDRDDLVWDTPISNTANHGCPTYPTNHCGTNDMTMNYMDYTYDRCMYMFTHGQKNRARAVFAPGGARARMARGY